MALLASLDAEMALLGLLYAGMALLGLLYAGMALLDLLSLWVYAAGMALLRFLLCADDKVAFPGCARMAVLLPRHKPAIQHYHSSCRPGSYDMKKFPKML